jgi:hypothetical protein
VFLGNKDHGYSATAGLPATAYCNGAWQHGITIVTPERCFLFTCETESDQQDWLRQFAAVLGAVMSPQEYTSRNTFLHLALCYYIYVLIIINYLFNSFMVKWFHGS